MKLASAAALSLRSCVAAACLSALLGCVPAQMVSPKAAGLAPEQSAWIVTHDDVLLVSLDGERVRPRVTFADDAFTDGVRDKMQLEPGPHRIEVNLDPSIYLNPPGTTLSIDTRAGRTYYIRKQLGTAVRYDVLEYNSLPNEKLLKSFDTNAPGTPSPELLNR
jgi:hypothetical protein